MSTEVGSHTGAEVGHGLRSGVEEAVDVFHGLVS
jgi:hypothetical protein